MPEYKPMSGLPVFLQSLRNAGMNPHLAGEISEDLVETGLGLHLREVR